MAKEETITTCPDCGYTKEDAGFHMDHQLCKNSGKAPWETEKNPLVVTRDGVPFADQAKGIRQFKAACLRYRPDMKTEAQNLAKILREFMQTEGNTPGGVELLLQVALMGAFQKGANNND